MSTGTAQFEQVASFEPPTVLTSNSLVSLSLSNRTNTLTHGLHRFPAKFIPQVPRWALDAYSSEGSIVLDPFAGSGTTNVEASARGLRSVALDINPLSRLIISAKTTPLDCEEAEAISKRIRILWRPKVGFLESPIAGVANFEHWFIEGSWRELAGLKDAVLKSTNDDEYRTFFLAVFSSILRAVSNADDQSQKTYVSGTRPKIAPPVAATWDNAIVKALAGLSSFVQTSGSLPLSTVPADGNALVINWADESFDLAVTSPPYLDSVDYPYNLMLEHFWLAEELGLASRRDFNNLRHGQVGAKSPISVAELPPFIAQLLDSDELPEYRREAVLSYFHLMNEHFAEMKRVLRNGSRYVFVIGNSSTKIGPLAVHKALVKLAELHGFGLEHAFGYRLRRHYMKFPRAGRGGIILVDWVLTLRKGLTNGMDVQDLVDSHIDADPAGVAH
ncbi:DNA methyltransferase [Cryobacterium sp. TmT2-59]|uniref:DNA methyltransferase n=1 Tax=Cryobacterium sp. TmT2-59 TaxID=1259264 RepID=UPI00141B4A00|nr:DNA methyltransferase [Cryobacterium sp. TmT2-59]